MKKILFLILILSLSSPLWADITMDSVQGSVEIMQPGDTSWSPIEQGEELPGNTRISTGFNSKAVLLVNGETRVTLKPLSRLTVEEATQQSNGTQNTRLFLGSGRIRADVKKTRGSTHDFKVRTPVATAAVRGTSFDMGSGRVDVSEGSVRFTVGSYSFTVNRGQNAQIRYINGRPGLMSPAKQLLSERQVQSETSDSAGDKTGSSGRSGYASIELR